jgi:hypothetical protein
VDDRSTPGIEPICLRPSSSHALISVLRASSPCPNNAEIAVSESGSVWTSFAGKESTERESASRVKPCVLTRGKARLRSRLLYEHEQI